MPKPIKLAVLYHQDWDRTIFDYVVDYVLGGVNRTFVCYGNNPNLLWISSFIEEVVEDNRCTHVLLVVEEEVLHNQRYMKALYQACQMDDTTYCDVPRNFSNWGRIELKDQRLQDPYLNNFMTILESIRNGTNMD